ncbi:MAG: cupin domain-containing protein [Acidobacteria bacterium]|nr:cupin domain-containing protein [Acidobacteriota bacterium]MCI0721971.1 cupin domain-containing protein [Acidobacteriota bacterium]
MQRSFLSLAQGASESWGGCLDFKNSPPASQNDRRRKRSWKVALRLCVSAVILFEALTALSVFPLSAAEPNPAAQLRFLTLADAVSFKMGRIEGKRMVYPGMGAKRLTFNYIESQPGDEFPQHVHDYSDDTFLVLQGQVDVRQGDSRRHLGTGHAAFVPNGQIHGTITTGTDKALLISFQAPPDLKLYSGERDSSKPGAKPPVGVITPGAVQLLEFQNKNGFFLHRGVGSQRVAVAYRTLKPAEEFQAEFPSSGEALLFVWKGCVTVQQGQSRHRLAEKNLLFAKDAGKVLVKNTTAAPSIVVQVQSPPDSSQAK